MEQVAVRRRVKEDAISEEVARLVREMVDLKDECPSDEEAERVLAMRSEEPVLPNSYWEADLNDIGDDW
jgi:hypothetical protein